MDIPLGAFYGTFATLMLILMVIFYLIYTNYFSDTRESNLFLIFMILMFINISLSIQGFVVAMTSYYNTQKNIADMNTKITNIIASNNAS